MKDIKVLGGGCTKCGVTAKLLEETAREMGVLIQLTKVEDWPTIAQYNVMTTPAVVIDGTIVHKGSVPAKTAVADWLKA